MPTMNLTAEDAKYYMEAQEKMGNKIIHSLKEYWAKNSETILAGMMAMSGQVYVPTKR